MIVIANSAFKSPPPSCAELLQSPYIYRYMSIGIDEFIVRVTYLYADCTERSSLSVFPDESRLSPVVPRYRAGIGLTKFAAAVQMLMQAIAGPAMQLRRLAALNGGYGQETLVVTRILVADDHPFFRLGVEAVLRTGGHEVVAMTEDGEETLEVIARENPEIVLLDIRMPQLDGISMLQALRDRGDDRPVIILTVEMTDDQLLAAIRAGVNGIVFKHYGEDSLLKAIDAVKNGLRYVDGELFDKAIAHAGMASSPSRLAALTPKELDVAQQVARGLRNREIADCMATTEGTVKVYLHNIYTKLGISNRTELAAIAFNEMKK